ncbi:MAG TPA: hypothetical protein VHU40_17235 [Polyangia bacterium]|nr:hypothetical protein [Polyangia bacterium]
MRDDCVVTSKRALLPARVAITDETKALQSSGVRENDVSSVPVGDGWNAALVRSAGGATLRVSRGEGERGLELTITITADGPVIKARAAALEIDSDTDLIARCGRFRVEARDSVDIVAGGTLHAEGRRVDVEATHGMVKLTANDDVQLLGENVLLNCEPTVPPPAWASAAPQKPAPSVPVAAASGDTELAADLASLAPGGAEGAD